jgi:hypothetical protein
MTGFDELLQSRVNQLRVIEDRLDRAEKAFETSRKGCPVESWKSVAATLCAEVRLLRCELLAMIGQAEREHAEF